MIRPAILIALACAPSLRAARLDLDFIHEADGKPLALDSLRYEKAAGETFSVTRLDWLADGFSLITSGGEILNPSINSCYVPTRGGSVSLGDLPAGKIAGITFHIGPDRTANHSDPASYSANHPLNPNVNHLHWDWQGGYIFMALEGHWRPAGGKGTEGYAYHFATDSYRTSVTLPIDLELRGDTRVAIALDAGRLLDGISFATDGATTHSRPGDPVANRMKTNLGGAFRIAAITRGGIPGPSGPPAPIDLPVRFTPYPLKIPRGLPLPPLPLDNPLIDERVTLGKALFHETALSRDNSISCATCHQQAHAFSDPRRYSLGVGGTPGNRNAMPLFNLAWKDRFFWDGRASSLRSQALIPIQDHREMDESLDRVVEKLRRNPDYPAKFAAAFGSGEITPLTIGLALENHLLTLVDFDSKFDRARQGRAGLTEVERRGMSLFFTEYEPRLGSYGADCFHCHGGALFTDHQFHNNGLAPGDDTGLEKTTGNPADRHKFSTPSLRNVALTAPYMHDGRFATLEEVVAHYNRGSAPSDTLDPNIAKHRGGLGLSPADQAALVAFLRTLSDSGAGGSDFAAGISELEARHGGRLGVAAMDLGGRDTLVHRGGERFAMCSTFKFLLAAAVAARVDAGDESWDRRIGYGNGDLLAWAPVTGKDENLKAGSMNVADLCGAAMTWSDNTAANLLLDSLGGPQGLTRHLRSIGDVTTRLDRIEPALNSNIPGDERDTTTPAAMMESMEKLLFGGHLKEASGMRLAEWLVTNHTGDKRIRAAMDPAWKVGDKTGSGENGAANDIAVVWPDHGEPILMVIFYESTKATADQRDSVIAETAGWIRRSFAAKP